MNDSCEHFAKYSDNDKEKFTENYHNIMSNGKILKKKCSFCTQKKAVQYESCEHFYCLECLKDIVDSTKFNLVKCKKCKKALGNKHHLSQIKLNKKE